MKVSFTNHISLKWWMQDKLDNQLKNQIMQNYDLTQFVRVFFYRIFWLGWSVEVLASTFRGRNSYSCIWFFYQCPVCSVWLQRIEKAKIVLKAQVIKKLFFLMWICITYSVICCFFWDGPHQRFWWRYTHIVVDISGLYNVC